MLRHIPMPAINTITEVPPLEINGRGSPVGGIDPVTTAILRRVCTPIIKATPQASKVPKRSGALSPIFISKMTKVKKTIISAISPK